MVKMFTKDQRGSQITAHFAADDSGLPRTRGNQAGYGPCGNLGKALWAVRRSPQAEKRPWPGFRKIRPPPGFLLPERAELDGQQKSPHCQGRATDVYIPGVAAYKLAQFAETLPEVGGIGLYLERSGQLEKVDYIHLDTGCKRSHWGWNNQTQGCCTPVWRIPAISNTAAVPRPSRNCSAG